jgi:hypothetical protein
VIQHYSSRNIGTTQLENAEKLNGQINIDGVPSGMKLLETEEVFKSANQFPLQQENLH